MLFFRRMSEGTRTFRVRNTALLIGGLALAGACGDSGNAGGAGGGFTASIGSSATSGQQSGSNTVSASSTASATQSSSNSDASSGDGSTSSGMGGMGGAGGGVNLPDYAPEMEPNNNFASPNPLPSGKLGFYGSLDSGQDSDSFSIVAYAGDSLRVKISDGMGGCPPGNVAFQLQVFDSDEDEIASVFAECPLLDGTVDPDMGSLPADDTYLVRVTALAIIPFYVVEIGVPPPVCGDGVKHATEECEDGNTMAGDGCDATCHREPVCGDTFLDAPPEECDDGNTVSGDGCDATCQFEGSVCPEVEPNNSLGETQYIQGCDAVAGQITPIGDQDFFKFDITQADSSVFIEITGFGAGTCPAGFDSFLRLYGPTGAQIASDDDTGVDACSLINGATVAAARNLAVGTYRLSVEEDGNNLASAPYLLRAVVRPPSCGDSIIQSGEACDDGNTTNGDGCDSSCAFEGCAEIEPNDTTATATQVTQACSDFAGSISPGTDSDYYEVDVTTPGSSIRVSTSMIGGSLCTGVGDTLVRLLNGAGTELGFDNDDGDASCSVINPSVDGFAANLAVGTYFVKVEESGTNAVIAGYAVHIDVELPECGDGIQQAGEACDDGNLIDGDFCDSMCQLPPDVCQEIEPNDSIATANPADDCILMRGGITAAGGVAEGDYFSIEVTVAGSSIRAETVTANGVGCPAGSDTVIRLFSPAGVELGSDDQDGIDSCSLISGGNDAFARNLPVGVYTVRVEDFLNNGAIPSYGLKLAVFPPGCGDGIVQAGETCDDQNTNPSDLCSNTCQLTPATVEVEPNGTIATANAQMAGTHGFTGQITPIGDEDYYAITVPAGADVRLELGGVPFSQSCPSDPEIFFYNAAGALLASDDDDSDNGLCSLLFGVNDPVMNNLPGGTYYVKVERHLDSSTVGPYTLLVTITP